MNSSDISIRQRIPSRSSLSSLADRPGTGTLAAMLRAKADAWFTPWRARMVALALWALAAWGDWITTAEAAFTLFYLIPLAIAIWYADLFAGYVIVFLSVMSGALVDQFVGPWSTNWRLFLWNQCIDAGMYIAFIHTLAALRTRVKLEIELRMDALGQLRHAERLTTIGKLAAGVAHEIGTPLNVITGYAELLMMGRGASSEEEYRELGRTLFEQSERVATIVRQLLDFARRGGSQTAPTDIGELVVSSAKLVETLARKSQVTVDSNVRSVSATVNRAEIQQVLTNLITNAVQAMPQGGRIELEVREERARAPGSLRGAMHDYVVLLVRDSGPGIAPDVLPRIFDPFFTTKDVGQGTGLGLSVAYGIVRDHGGWIGVDTRFGEGTTFSVYLPRCSSGVPVAA